MANKFDFTNEIYGRLIDVINEVEEACNTDLDRCLSSHTTARISKVLDACNVLHEAAHELNEHLTFDVDKNLRGLADLEYKSDVYVLRTCSLGEDSTCIVAIIPIDLVKAAKDDKEARAALRTLIKHSILNMFSFKMNDIEAFDDCLDRLAAGRSAEFEDEFFIYDEAPRNIIVF